MNAIRSRLDGVIQRQVLVLDPDVSVGALVAAVLRRKGFDVTVCHTDRAAAEHCQQPERYAAVILSADMPDIQSLVRQLYAADERPRIILTTTRDAPRHVTQADLVLMKPFHLDELQAALAPSGRPSTAGAPHIGSSGH